ncbi:MBL fold metallo-hydrolase [Laceyella putida]|uniref:MBL fold metallo-hydrolase n=1 Tax=Laceyella putida TaxID=110101 RepID=A0ABW2RH96_9BACL
MNLFMLNLSIVAGLVVLVGVGLSIRFGKQTPPLVKPANMLKPAEWPAEDVTVGWVGHSTVLMSLYGVKVITDPVLGDRVGQQLGVGDWQIGLRRHVAPAVTYEDLGDVDVILLSHAHFDHCDIPTLKRLAHPDAVVIVPKNISHLLRGLPFKRIVELGGEEKVELAEWGLTVRAVPVKHWGNRYPWNTNYGYTGYLLEKRGTRIFFPGDTAYTPDFYRLRDLGQIDVSFMPIGAYYPDKYQWAHCTPEQAWQMFIDTGAKVLVPIHWDTIRLSQEPLHEPLERLLAVSGEERDRIVIKKHGETYTLVKKKTAV